MLAVEFATSAIQDITMESKKKFFISYEILINRVELH